MAFINNEKQEIVSKEKAVTPHTALCIKADKWLRNTNKCMCAAVELVTWATQERPDAIGFSVTDSTLIEVKMSRADFKVDAKKYYRINPDEGLGDFRYYLAPQGLLTVKDLPEGWGLLEECGRTIKTVKKSDRFIKNSRAEMGFLASMVRRADDEAKGRKRTKYINQDKQPEDLYKILSQQQIANGG